MITTKINIKPHLKEYVTGKFCAFTDSPVRFPDRLDIYCTIWDLTEKRPVNCPVDSGNMEIVLPDRQEGKSPESYNYLGERSQKIIGKKIEIMFWADLREYVDYKHHVKGVTYVEAITEFVRKYGICSISEDALVKNYYRWRKKVRIAEKRAYHSKKINE
jgi:hypothetical protein